jgi:hypothetical protein
MALAFDLCVEDVDVLGPVEDLIVEFPADETNFSGEMAAALEHAELLTL